MKQLTPSLNPMPISSGSTPLINNIRLHHFSDKILVSVPPKDFPTKILRPRQDKNLVGSDYLKNILSLIYLSQSREMLRNWHRVSLGLRHLIKFSDRQVVPPYFKDKDGEGV